MCRSCRCWPCYGGVACGARPRRSWCVDAEDRNPRIIDADANAQAAGVRVGMTLGAALALAPHHRCRGRAMPRASSCSCGAWPASPPRSRRRCPSNRPMACCSRSSRASRCSAACGRCAASCAMPAARIRCSRRRTAATALHAGAHRAGCARRRRAPARVAFITDANVLPGAAQTTAARHAALARRAQRAPRRAWGCARSASSCACRAQALRNASGWPCLPISTGCSGPRRSAPPARAARTLSRTTRFRSRDHRPRPHPAGAVAFACRTRAIPARAPARHHRTPCRFHHYRAEPTRCVLRLATPETSAARLLALAARTPRDPGTARTRAPLRSAQAGRSASARSPASRCGRPVSAATPRRVKCRRSSNICAPDSVRRRCMASRRVSEHRPENAWRAKKGSRSIYWRCASRPLTPAINQWIRVCFGEPPAAVAAARAAGARIPARPAAASRRARVADRPRTHRKRLVGSVPISSATITSPEMPAARACGSTANARAARKWFLHGLFG